MNFWPALVDRHLGHIRNRRLERVVHRDAESSALGECAPAITGLRDREIERLPTPLRVLSEQRAAVFDRVAIYRSRDFIDQRFHDIRGMRVSDGAVPQHGHVGFHVVH